MPIGAGDKSSSSPKAARYSKVKHKQNKHKHKNSSSASQRTDQTRKKSEEQIYHNEPVISLFNQKDFSKEHIYENEEKLAKPPPLLPKLKNRRKQSEQNSTRTTEQQEANLTSVNSNAQEKAQLLNDVSQNHNSPNKKDHFQVLAEECQKMKRHVLHTTSFTDNNYGNCVNFPTKSSAGGERRVAVPPATRFKPLPNSFTLHNPVYTFDADISPSKAQSSTTSLNSANQISLKQSSAKSKMPVAAPRYKLGERHSSSSVLSENGASYQETAKMDYGLPAKELIETSIGVNSPSPVQRSTNNSFRKCAGQNGVDKTDKHLSNLILPVSLNLYSSTPSNTNTNNNNVYDNQFSPLFINLDNAFQEEKTQCKLDDLSKKNIPNLTEVKQGQHNIQKKDSTKKSVNSNKINRNNHKDHILNLNGNKQTKFNGSTELFSDDKSLKFKDIDNLNGSPLKLNAFGRGVIKPVNSVSKEILTEARRITGQFNYDKDSQNSLDNDYSLLKSQQRLLYEEHGVDLESDLAMVGVKDSAENAFFDNRSALVLNETRQKLAQFEYLCVLSIQSREADLRAILQARKQVSRLLLASRACRSFLRLTNDKRRIRHLCSEECVFSQVYFDHQFKDLSMENEHELVVSETKPVVLQLTTDQHINNDGKRKKFQNKDNGNKIVSQETGISNQYLKMKSHARCMRQLLPSELHHYVLPSCISRSSFGSALNEIDDYEIEQFSSNNPNKSNCNGQLNRSDMLLFSERFNANNDLSTSCVTSRSESQLHLVGRFVESNFEFIDVSYFDNIDNVQLYETKNFCQNNKLASKKLKSNSISLKNRNEVIGSNGTRNTNLSLSNRSFRNTNGFNVALNASECDSEYEFNPRQDGLSDDDSSLSEAIKI